MMLLAALAFPLQEDPDALAHADGVIALLERLVRDDPESKDAPRWEALADAYMLRVALMKKGPERDAWARKADAIFARLAVVLFPPGMTADTWRLLWKHARALREYDPDRLKRFFEVMTLRGHAPDWDKGPFKEKLEKLRPKP